MTQWLNGPMTQFFNDSMAQFLLLTLAFAYAVFQKGGVWPQDWNISLLVLGLLALFYRPRTPVPRHEPWLRWPLIHLPAYAAFQLLPLPNPLLRLLSPARAEIQAALGGNFAPLSVVPAATLRHFLRIAVYVLVFLLVRELAWRLSRRPWSLAFPLVAIAALEAALGLVQFYSKGSEGLARGTYVNRNHYAGLLEMSLPFALMYPVAVLRRNRSPDHSPVRPALIACAVLALAALILLGIIHSLSRMGFIAALVSLFVCGTAILLQTARYKLWSASRKLLVVLFVAALILFGFIFLPPDQLIARFGQLAFSDGITSQDRLQLWRETLPLIAAYPLFGCGLGGYESAFMKYKISEPHVPRRLRSQRLLTVPRRARNHRFPDRRRPHRRGRPPGGPRRGPHPGRGLPGCLRGHFAPQHRGLQSVHPR